MTDSASHRLREAALKKMDELLAASPEAVETRFERACLLGELGRKEEAKSAYLDVLAKEPAHFGALNNLGNLLYGMGFTTAACTLYTQAVALHPENPKAHVNLASLLAARNEPEQAMKHFEAALRLDPDHMQANRGLAYLLTESRDEQRAAFYRQKAFEGRPVEVLPYYGEDAPITLLLLVSALGGIIPMRHHFDERIFLVSVIFVEFYDPAAPLPPHQLVVNAIGDADLCKTALQAAMQILAQTQAPVINHPSRVLLTGRAENAERLAHIQDVITPKIALLRREFLETSDAPARLAKQGFAFPLLLRAPGFHTGRFFIRVENAQELVTGLPSMPGEEFLVIQYLDARNRDGKIRKYRVMMIDGVLYPVHVAISHEWKIHYFTAEMADNPQHRAEDAVFLDDMPQVLGPRAMQALAKISETLGLDYGGIDFSVNADGKILLFEANATMVIYPANKDSRWDYRRPAVQHILDAIYRILTKRDPRYALLPIEALLTSGGDARILRDHYGMNKYGCATLPQPGILSYSSSTASTISTTGYAATIQLYERLKEASHKEAAPAIYATEMNRALRELRALCDLNTLPGLEIISGASGTHLHLFAAQLLREDNASLLVIMPDPSETGSGVGTALQGRHFGAHTALGGAAISGSSITAGENIEVIAVKSRMLDGALRPEAAVDREIETLVAQAVAEGRHVLLMLTDVSKTGLIIPSPACALTLRQRFGSKMDVLVDACQFRLAVSTLRTYLDHEFLVAITGSKFVTGPAFCGALLVPHAIAQRLQTRPLSPQLQAYSARADWPPAWAARQALNDIANYGLLLRFEAALAEMRAFRCLCETRILHFLETFRAAVQERLANDPVFEPLAMRKMDRQPLVKNTTWDHIPTIFPFLLRHAKTGALFTSDETTRLYELMKSDLGHHPAIPSTLQQTAAQRCLLGQPVAYGVQDAVPVSALRLSMDMRLIVDALSPEGRGSNAVISEALATLDKAALLAEYLVTET